VTSLKSRLALLGVEVPEYRACVQEADARKALKIIDGRADIGPKGSAAWVVATAITELREAREHIASIEAACAQLAGEVERLRAKIEPPEEKESGADLCPACDGDGTPDGSHFEPIPCHYCGGTGRRP